MSTQTRATRSGSFFTTVLLTSLLAGCSTAAYKTEIKSFKSSTDGATNALKNYATETAKIKGLNKFRKMLLADEEVQVSLTDACEIIVTGETRVEAECVVQLNGEAFEEEKYNFKLLDDLAQYAGNLEKVASSKDSDKAQKAIEELSGAVVSFAKASGATDAEKKQVEGVVGPVTTIISWIAGNYIDYKRWTALKEATGHIHPEIKNAKEQLNGLAKILHKDYALARLTQFVKLPNIVQRGDCDDSVAQIVALQAEAREVATLINSKPAGMFDTMVKAHGELTRAIADPERQATAVYSALREFKGAVDDVKKAFGKEIAE